MSATTSIEWTDRSWNPVRGCSVISPGCVNCYAMKFAHRFSAPGKPYAGLTKQTKAGPQWTGVVRTVEDALLEPLSWRKPARIFVNSMSDLFHEDVPDEFIAAVFGVMAACPQHTFQVLTKRAARLPQFFEWLDAQEEPGEPRLEVVWQALCAEKESVGDQGPLHTKHCAAPSGPWPLPNVWLGVSCENQEQADKRIPLLLDTPAAVRWVSAEPLLSAINLRRVQMPNFQGDLDALSNIGSLPELDWVVVGGESGPGARECDVAWVRDVVRQCRSASVPVFVKQLGQHVIDRNDAGFEGDPGDSWTPETRYEELTSQGWQGDPVRIRLRNRKGGDLTEWPVDLRVREYPRVEVPA